MSIILKGINLPKDGEMHRINIYDNGNTYITTSNRWYETEMKDIEAIQISTPHGRLIDANKIFTYSHWEEQAVNEAPTILEAEE